MNKNTQKLAVRNLYLAVGVVAMLFAGILYAWSILKAPLSAEFGWGTSELALNFTLAMTFFCIGGLLGARLLQWAGHKIAILLSGALAASGFILTAFLNQGAPVTLLYLTYGALAGSGIGIAYNVVIATVSAWFPDKKGVCSGCLMMGFGGSAFVLGNLADAMFKNAIGWRGTYIALGVALFVVLALAALILKQPGADVCFPQSTQATAKTTEQQDFAPKQMLARPSFWMAFLCISALAAVGSSAISFAKDLLLSVKAPETLAIALVGVLSICNGIGRIITGALFDRIGRRKTMISANLFSIGAAAITLTAVCTRSLILCILGVCLIGLSYGACPTITAAFTSSFFGMKHFSNNMALFGCNLMVASFIATASNKVLEATGGYTAPFMMLLALTVFALILNVLIKKP